MNTFLFSRGIRAADLYHTSNDMGFPSVQKGDNLHSPFPCQLSPLHKKEDPHLMKFIRGPILKDCGQLEIHYTPES